MIQNTKNSVMVINALAVKIAAIRGGIWSWFGKNIEAPLMLFLYDIFGVSEKYYSVKNEADSELREVDFYLMDAEGQRINCEVKLQGEGNPEGTDAVFARGSQVSIGSELSDTNKTQLEQMILWVELQTENEFMKFGHVLARLGIFRKTINPNESVESYVDDVLAELV